MISDHSRSGCFENRDPVNAVQASCISQAASFCPINEIQWAIGSTITEKKKPCTVALIDPRPLTRISIARLLSGTSTANRRSEDFTIWPLASLEKFFTAHPPDRLQVASIVVNLGALCPRDEKVQADCARLLSELPEIPAILLSDCINSSHILQTLRGGVRGYIPSVLESSMVMQAIRLVLAGGVFIPPQVLAEEGTPLSLESESEDGPRPRACGFTPRQTEVFDLLRQGKSNKLIAYELRMQESTVKVHVRQIMRKLKAINRTHAVFLANSMVAGGPG